MPEPAADGVSRFVRGLPDVVERHRTPDGAYVRFRGDAATASVGDVYGTADAVGVLWSAGAVSPGDERATTLGAALRAMQHPDGRFADPSHGNTHTTALALGSLLLLDELPARGAAFLDPYWRPDALPAFLEALDWGDPWGAAHDAAGIASIGSVTGDASPAWLEAYFDWMRANVDPETGMWLAGRMGGIHEWPGLFGNLGGAFHMYFVHAWHRVAWPAAERIVDTCIRLYDAVPALTEGELSGWVELDWVYTARRASAQAGYRVREVRERIDRYYDRVEETVSDAGFAETEGATDLHTLSALSALVAELQLAAPERTTDGARLRQVIDARPFI